jgi:DNA-binding MarR family transcriptional regulator
VALVDKLSLADLVRRVPSLQDRREVLVEITEKGETLLTALSELHHDQLQSVGPRLIGALSAVLHEHARHNDIPEPDL